MTDPIGHMANTLEYRELSKEQVEELKKPISPQFLGTRFDGMTSIKSIAVTMRFNEVFGYGKWQIRTDNMQTKPDSLKAGGEKNAFYSTCKVIFDVPEYGIHMECEAGSKNKEEGDSMKGAITDSMTKIASWLGIGWQIYCGK